MEGEQVAHKFGVNTPVETLLDCGIAYVPEKPYAICIMSQGASSLKEASTMMKEVSEVTYEYFAAKTGKS
ncbi:hypothetical protein HY492_03280 [Candidatus Woesearchaeota archaeon]|nr:hypothetical protein [Candidatus Woesearchaeota archaeon]